MLMSSKVLCVLSRLSISDGYLKTKSQAICLNFSSIDYLFDAVRLFNMHDGVC